MKRMRIGQKSQRCYLVEWEGYDISQATWEPFNHVQGTIAYSNFLSQQQQQQQQHQQQQTQQQHVDTEQTQHQRNIQEQQQQCVQQPNYEHHMLQHAYDQQHIQPNSDADAPRTTFLCPVVSCGAYVTSKGVLHHINAKHLGDLLPHEAASQLQVVRCPHCSQHFRRIGAHQCTVKHLTPFNNKHQQQTHNTPLAARILSFADAAQQ